MKSPCVRKCLYDEEQNLCKGCLRTREEISKWYKMTDTEKRNVFSRLREREKAKNQEK